MSANYPTSGILRVETTSNNNETIQFSSLIFSIIGYNEQDTLSWPFPAAQITFGTFTTASSFLDNNNLFETWNTFWGLHGINITGNSQLAFDSRVTQHI